MSGNIGKCALKMSSKAISMDNVTCIKLWVYLKQFPQTAMKMFHGNGVKMEGSLECDIIK